MSESLQTLFQIEAYWSITSTLLRLIISYSIVFFYGPISTVQKNAAPIFPYFGQDLVIGLTHIISYLVGGLEHFLFFHILGILIPTDFHSMIFQRGWLKPPTRYHWDQKLGVFFNMFRRGWDRMDPKNPMGHGPWAILALNLDPSMTGYTHTQNAYLYS
jgi:hypothetical protein